MGRDASVHIWVGVAYADFVGDAPEGGSDPIDKEKDTVADRDVFLLTLPKELFEPRDDEAEVGEDDDDYGDERNLLYGDDVKKVTGGVELEEFRVGEETVGFGVPVFWTDWDFGAALFNPDALSNRISDARRALSALFLKWGLTPPIKTWICTNYS